MKINGFYTTRKEILSFIMFLFISSTTNNIRAQSAQAEIFSNIVIETIGSFLDNPFHHSNTIKIEKLLKEQEKANEKLCDYAWKQQEDYRYYRNTLRMIKVFYKFVDYVTNNYSIVSWDSEDMEQIVDPILKSFDWEKTLLCSCQYIEVYKYQKENFKMTVVHNTLPSQGKYASYFSFVSYKLYHINPLTNKLSTFMTHICADGEYQVIQYKDDTNTNRGYRSVKKVESRRGADTNW